MRDMSYQASEVDCGLYCPWRQQGQGLGRYRGGSVMYNLSWPDIHFSSLTDAEECLGDLKTDLLYRRRQRLDCTELIELIEELDELIFQCKLDPEF